MKVIVYQYRPEDEEFILDKYAKEHNIDLITTDEPISLENISLAKGCDFILVGDGLMSDAMVDKLSEYGVKIIGSRTKSVRHIPIYRAKKKDIHVLRSGFAADSQAEYAIMLMLMGLRKVKQVLRRSAAQDFRLIGNKGRTLRGLTVGVVGTGSTGTAVIERLSCFGANILAFDEKKNDEVAKMAEYVSFDKLLKESDVVTIHLPDTSTCRHLFDVNTFAKMKEGALLINTAGGGLVNTKALIMALESGHLGGAALDDVEESPRGHHDYSYQQLRAHEPAILKSFANVIITPMMCQYTKENTEQLVINSMNGCMKVLNNKETVFKVI